MSYVLDSKESRGRLESSFKEFVSYVRESKGSSSGLRCPFEELASYVSESKGFRFTVLVSAACFLPLDPSSLLGGGLESPLEGLVVAMLFLRSLLLASDSIMIIIFPVQLWNAFATTLRAELLWKVRALFRNGTSMAFDSSDENE